MDAVDPAKPTNSKWKLAATAIFKVGSFAGVAAALIAIPSYIMDRGRRQDEYRKDLHTSLVEAEELYCGTEPNGVTFQLKTLVERAAAAEPNVADATPMQYLALASVGSKVLSHDRACKFAEEGLRRAEGSAEELEKYALNLVSGHINVLQFQDTSNPAFLSKARERFRTAIDLVDHGDSKKGKYFVGQAYLVWATHELATENEGEAELRLEESRRAWSNLPQQESLLNRIGDTIADVRRSKRPFTPCPSMLTVSPPLYSSITVASDRRPELANDDSTPTESRSEAAVERLSEELKSFAQTTDQRFDELRSLFVKKPLEEGNLEPPELQRHDMLEPPLTPPAPKTAPNWPPAYQPRPGQNSFVLYNRTAYPIRPIINGHQLAAWELGPNEWSIFSIQVGELRLQRSAVQTPWELASTAFFGPDGKPVSRIIEITDCCFVDKGIAP